MNVSRFLVLFTVMCFVLFFGSTSFAQPPQPTPPPGQAPTALAAGASSLSFAVPTGGNPYAPGTLGYWMMLTPEFNLGINVGFAFDRQANGDDTITSWDILLAPAIKYYTSRMESVAPYYFGQVNFRIQDSGIEGVDDDLEMSVALGLGAEWFPVQTFSIGGHVGLGIDVLRPGDQEPVRVGTFTSGLTAQIYF